MKTAKIITAAAVFALMMPAAGYAENTHENGYIVKFAEDTVMLYSDEYTPLIPEVGLYFSDTIPEGAAYEYIEPNMEVELYDTYDYSYAMDNYETAMTDISGMWDIGAYGNGVKIGIVDSGCDRNAALPYTEGHNYVDDSSDCTDNINHGTAVSGMAAAAYGKADVIGAAHKAEIVPLKFIDKNSSGTTIGGTVAHMMLAIRGGVDEYGCDILNISAGVSQQSFTLKTAVDYAVENGVIVVSAVGNNYDSSYNYPAAYDNVIGVGSVDKNYSHSSFSNYNDSVFVTAPGEKVKVLYNENGIRESSGTSFSSPYIAGIIACMLDINPDLSLDEIKSIIAETAVDLGDEGYDNYYGCGLVDAGAIAEKMTGDMDYYVSDIDVCPDDGFSEVRIKRREGMSAPAGIWSAYSDGVLCDIRFESMDFTGDICIMRYKKPENTSLKCFIWDSVSGMRPVAEAVSEQYTEQTG